MTADGTRVVEAARRWLGTPFVHRHRVKGRGIDCIGLVKEVGVETGLLPLQRGAGAAWRLYSRLPDPADMGTALAAFLEPIPAASEIPPVGVIVWLGWDGGPPRHVGIIGRSGGRPTIIHVLEVGGRGCVEHRFPEDWARRVAGLFRFPLMGV